MSHQGPALALDSAAYGEAPGLRRGENIIDSLAYIDTISDAEKLAAENLIKEEVGPLSFAGSTWVDIVSFDEMLWVHTHSRA